MSPDINCSIQCRNASEATIGAYAAMTLYGEHGASCDTVLIAAFGDPRLA